MLKKSWIHDLLLQSVAQILIYFMICMSHLCVILCRSHSSSCWLVPLFWEMKYDVLHCVWILTDRQVKTAKMQTDMQTIISLPFTWLIIFSLWLIQQMCQAVFIIVIIKILTWVQKYSSSYKSASRIPLSWWSDLLHYPSFHFSTPPPHVTLLLNFQ